MAAGMPVRTVLVTAPSRIPHGEAVRNAVRVEWMRLETAADLTRAGIWLSEHGVENLQRDYDKSLTLYNSEGAFAIARFGQVLAFVPESGEFSVWDWPRFVDAHPGVSR